MPPPAVRHAKLGEVRASLEQRADGSMIVRNAAPLGPHCTRITDRLDHWAAVAPDRTWLAQRRGDGQWQRITYSEGRARVRELAAALAARNLGPERPIAILSGNSLAHALLGTAALYAGVPYAPIAPAYATVASDFKKLRGVIDLLTPGLVFIEDAAPFARAIHAVVPADAELVVERNAPADRTCMTLADLGAEGRASQASLDGTAARATADDIAKFLFTSGSTGVPKAVINTQRMLCANVEQITAHFAFFRDEPPVIVDWAPWNHTAGGNHNFNFILHNGGTLYIDDGRPTAGGIGETVRTLREIAPTWYFNVPKGYAALLPHLAADEALRRNFFSRVKVLWYAGAGMARYVWEELDRLATLTVGERIAILTGLGATETAPFALGPDLTMVDAGLIGLPARGCELKLVATGAKLEARLRGPNITPGYWRRPEATRQAFDEEGFYRLGDALRFADRGDINKGFYFDGRITEDFKLSTGTWVAVGPLRSALIDHFAPYLQDAVIAGLDRDFVAALVFLDLEQCRTLAEAPAAGLSALATHPSVRAMLHERLRGLADAATGSSNRIERLIVVADAPSIDSAEMTDKGSLNQTAVLANRHHLVEQLFAAKPGGEVIAAELKVNASSIS